MEPPTPPDEATEACTTLAQIPMAEAVLATNGCLVCGGLKIQNLHTHVYDTQNICQFCHDWATNASQGFVYKEGSQLRLQDAYLGLAALVPEQGKEIFSREIGNTSYGARYDKEERQLVVRVLSAALGKPIHLFDNSQTRTNYLVNFDLKGTEGTSWPKCGSAMIHDVAIAHSPDLQSRHGELWMEGIARPVVHRHRRVSLRVFNVPKTVTSIFHAPKVLEGKALPHVDWPTRDSRRKKKRGNPVVAMPIKKTRLSKDHAERIVKMRHMLPLPTPPPPPAQEADLLAHEEPL